MTPLLLLLAACPRHAPPTPIVVEPPPAEPAWEPEVAPDLRREVLPLLDASGRYPVEVVEAAPAGDGRWLVVTPNETVLLASTAGTVMLGELASPQSVAASPNGRWGVAGGYEVVAAWDLTTRAPAWTWTHPENCRTLAWLPDSSGVLSAVLRDVTLHDASTGAPRWTWTAPEPTELGRADSVSALAVSPDGRRVYTHADRDLVVLDAATGADTVLATLPERVDSLAVSPSGGLVAAGLWDKSFVVLDATSGQLLHRFPAAAWGEALAWSPDGQRLALLDLEGRLELRDLGGALLGALNGESGGVVFTPDGRLWWWADGEVAEVGGW